MEKALQVSIVFIAVVVLVIVLQALQSFIRPFIIAIILTLLLMPLMRRLEKKNVPFMVTFAGVIIAFAFLVVLLVVLFSHNLSGLADTIPKQQENVRNMAANLDTRLSQFSVAGAPLSLSQFVDPEKIGSYIATGITLLLLAARLIITEVFLVLLFMIFIIPSYNIMLRDIESIFGKIKAGKVKSVLFQIEKSTRDYLVTKTAISLGTAFASAVVLIFFKADLVFFLATLIFVLNFIPNIGSFVAVVIALGSYSLTHGFVLDLLWLSLLLIAIQIAFGNIIEPKLTGHRLRLSPIVILLGLFFWGWTWGVVGMFLAVPLMSILKIILENIGSTKTVARFMS